MQVNRFAIALSAALVLSALSGCGNSSADEPEATAAGEAAEETIVEASVVYQAQGTTGEANIAFVGAETFTDIKGDDAIRFYYDYTNLSGEVDYAASVYFTVTQDGEECENTSTLYNDTVDESGNQWLDVRPGVTIRCVEEVEVNLDGGDVTITASASGNTEEDCIAYTVSLDNLTGRPDNWEMQTYEEPMWVSGNNTTGGPEDGSMSISIKEYEVISATSGNPLVRFYVDFTNNGEETTTFSSATYYHLMQDGIQMDDGAPATAADEDENVSVVVEPGETVTVAVLGRLRTSSPVELEFYDPFTSTSYCSYIADVAEGFNYIVEEEDTNGENGDYIIVGTYIEDDDEGEAEEAAGEGAEGSVSDETMDDVSDEGSVTEETTDDASSAEEEDVAAEDISAE